MNDWLVAGFVLIGILILARYAYRRGWISKPRGSFTGLAVYHDWANKDKQQGTKEIVHRLAGDKEEEDDTGEPDFDTFVEKQKRSNERNEAHNGSEHG